MSARGSNSSLGSFHRPRKSLTGDSQQTQQTGTDTSSVRQNAIVRTSQESSELLKDSSLEPEKRGLFGKWKAKMAQSKDERKERELEKERARSPLRSEGEHTGSRHSLTGFVNDHLPHRGRSMEQQRETALPRVNEASAAIHTMSPVPPTPVTAIKTTTPGQTNDAVPLDTAGEASAPPPVAKSTSKVGEQ